MTDISAPGAYAGGDYKASANAAVSGVDGFVFTGDTRFDINGKTISNTAGGNAWTHGIKCSGKLTLYDSSGGNGKITGFRVGVLAEGANSVINGVDLSGNAYMGAWFKGAGGKVTGCLIADIAGVTDEPYAIGVQANADNVEVINTRFRNLYKQAGYTGAGAGEGVGVNFTTDSHGGRAEDCSFENDEAKRNTYGVFAGGDSNKVNRNTFRNMWRAAAMWNGGAPEAKNNIALLEAPLSGSSGISCEALDDEAVSHNLVIGYEDPYWGNTPIATNVALDFPGFPDIEPGEFGTSLLQTLAGSFGNVTDKSIRVRVAQAALTLPTDAPQNIKITLRGHADEPISYSKLFVGHAGADASATSLTQMTVGGQTSWVIPAGQTVVAEAPFAYNKTSDLIFSSFHSGGVNSDRMAANSSFAGATTYHKYGDEAGIGSVSGFSAIAGYLSGVEKIEMDGF